MIDALVFAIQSLVKLLLHRLCYNWRACVHEPGDPQKLKCKKPGTTLCVWVTGELREEVKERKKKRAREQKERVRESCSNLDWSWTSNSENKLRHVQVLRLWRTVSRFVLRVVLSLATGGDICMRVTSNIGGGFCLQLLSVCSLFTRLFACVAVTGRITPRGDTRTGDVITSCASLPCHFISPGAGDCRWHQYWSRFQLFSEPCWHINVAAKQFYTRGFYRYDFHFVFHLHSRVLFEIQHGDEAGSVWKQDLQKQLAMNHK